MPSPDRLGDTISLDTIIGITRVTDSLHTLEERWIRNGRLPEGSRVNAFVFDCDARGTELNLPTGGIRNVQYLHPGILGGQEGVVMGGTYLFVARPARIIGLTELRVRWSDPVPLEHNLELAGAKVYPRITKNHRLVLDESILKLFDGQRLTEPLDSFWVHFGDPQELFEWLKVSIETCGPSLATVLLDNLTLAAGMPEKTLNGRLISYRVPKEIKAGEAGDLHQIVDKVFTQGRMERLFQPLRVLIDHELDEMGEAPDLMKDLVRVGAGIAFLSSGSADLLGISEDVRVEAVTEFNNIRTRVLQVARGVPEQLEENERIIAKAAAYLDAHQSKFNAKRVAEMREDMERQERIEGYMRVG